MKFEWDEQKSKKNALKHGISLNKSILIFLSPHISLELSTSDEKRWVAIGKIDDFFYSVIYTKRSEKIRLISARRSRKEEVQYYDKYFG